MVEVVLVHDEVPAEMLESQLYLEGVAGSFEGAMSIGGGKGASSSVEVQPQERRARYRCRWS